MLENVLSTVNTIPNLPPTPNDPPPPPSEAAPPPRPGAPRPHKLCFAPHHGCGICYEAVGPAEFATPMFCCHHLHVVHHRCLAKWMLQKRLENAASHCPFCRRHLLTTDQFDALFLLVPCDHAQQAVAEPVISMLGPPTSSQAAELRLVRLTLLSWVTMLVNFIIAAVLFTLCLRAMQAASRQ
jgi:hypothetical protein